MPDTITPASYSVGQQIRCTITTSPRSKGAESTLVRLMRLDPASKRAMTRAHRERMQNLLVRSRGGRPWCVREHAAKIVRAETGETWTMPFLPKFAPDLNSVAEYLKIEKA